MPAFARGKLLIENQCVTYRPKVDFSYSGPNPQNAYKKLLKILIDDIHIPRENVQEKYFKWDRSGPAEKFTAAWEAVKDFDKYSYMFLEIEMNGTVNPSEQFGKEGTVSLTMAGIVRTEYPQDTTWEKSFFYEIMRTFYHKIFYDDKIKQYVSECRDWMLFVQNELKSFFNILQKE
jgi:hypothetical protein